MPTKALFRTGIAGLLIGVFIFWCVPIWLRAIEIYPGDHQHLSAIGFWFLVSLAGAGGLLLCRAAIRKFRGQLDSEKCLRIFPGMVLRNILPWHRHRPIPLITQLPNFGVVFGFLLWVLLFIFMIFKGPYPSYGLRIALRTHDSVIWQKSPWPETLSVYLAVGEKYFVNGRPVPRENLRAELEKELNHRMVRTVYFEADFDTLNMNAIYAMDTIQGLGAKVMWLTPKVREEIQQMERGR